MEWACPPSTAPLAQAPPPPSRPRARSAGGRGCLRRRSPVSVGGERAMRRSGLAWASSSSSLGAPLLAALLLLLTLGPPGLGPRPTSAQSVWTAWLNVSWRLPGSNVSAWSAGESGLFGQDSPVRPAAGLVVAPDAREGLNACSPRSNFSGAPAHRPWVALVQRGGGCMFSIKINAAARLRAQAVAVFNYDGAAGPEVQIMTHPGTGNTVAIMISYAKGREILQKIEKGYQVTMAIEVGKKHGSWMNNYSIFFVSVSFFIVTAATVGYFIFYSARRLRVARAQNRRQRRLKADARKAIGQLQLRTLKQGDKETGPDADSCAVCIEAYKPNDVVRILTCNHLFHKSCIDPWLLEHRTCPMCKCDILKALGIEVDIEERGEATQARTASSEASNVPSVSEEDNHSETASSGYASVQGADEPAPEERVTPESDHLHLVNASQTPKVDTLPHLDNPGFEGDEAQEQPVKS